MEDHPGEQARSKIKCSSLKSFRNQNGTVLSAEIYILGCLGKERSQVCNEIESDKDSGQSYRGCVVIRDSPSFLYQR